MRVLAPGSAFIASGLMKLTETWNLPLSLSLLLFVRSLVRDGVDFSLGVVSWSL